MWENIKKLLMMWENILRMPTTSTMAFWSSLAFPNNVDMLMIKRLVYQKV
jgi:hypothetical protein